MSLVVQIGADTKAAKAGIEEVSLSLKQQQAVLTQLRYEYSKLSTAERDAFKGKELAADIRIASGEIQYLKNTSVSAFGAIGSSATKGFSAIRQLAYILPGIGIAGIFSAAFTGLSALVDDLLKAKAGVLDFGDAIKASQDKFTEAFVKINETAEAIRLAKQGFISGGDAVKVFNENLGKSLGYVTDLTEAEKKLNESGAAFIKVTLFKAAAQNILADASKAAFDLIRLQNLSPSQQKLLNIIPGSDIIKGRLPGRERDLQKAIDEGIAAYQKVMDGIGKFAKEHGIDLFENISKPKKAQKIKVENLFIQAPQIEIEGLVDKTFIKFKEVALDAQKLTFSQQFEKHLQDEIEKLVHKPTLNFSPAILDYLERMKDKAAEVKSQLKELNETIKTLLNDSLAAFGEGLGNLFSGGGVQDAFASFARVIGSGLQAIGKQFIAMGTAALLAKEAISKLFSNPYIAIAAGIALVAIGAALNNVVNKGLSGRAAGGGVAGGQPYFVGEAGREVFVPSTAGRIIPNNSLGGLTGQAVQPIMLNGRLAVSGQELVLLISRANQYQERNV